MSEQLLYIWTIPRNMWYRMRNNYVFSLLVARS